MIGLSYASLLEGAVLTETVFAWPGLGLYITRSLFNADMNAVLGGTLVVGAVFIGVNATCDFLYRDRGSAVARGMSGAAPIILRTILARLARRRGAGVADAGAARRVVARRWRLLANPLAATGLAIVVALVLTALLSPACSPDAPRRSPRR